jgi:hypothetical protein
MLKPNLIFAAIFSAATIASGGLPGSASATPFEGSESPNSAASNEQQTILLQKQPNSTPTKAAIAVVILAGLLVAGFFYKNRRSRQAKSVSKIDRFQEEFLCGPLAHLYSSSADATALPSNIQGVAANFNADATVSPASPAQTDSTLYSDTGISSSDPTSGRTQYLELIDQIVATALKGQIRSQDYIYQKLLQNVSCGTSKLFERCLNDRLSTAQSELDSVADAKSLFQPEQPELKKARLTRTIKALQSIQAECERLQQHYRTQAAIAKAVEQIIAAPSSDRLATLVRVLDPNQTHVLNFDQLQQLAKSLAAEGTSSDDPNFKWEIEQLSGGITRGLKSCQQLEGYLVRWIYEPTKSRLGFQEGQRRQQDPWACWAQQVSSPLPQQIF